METGNDTRKTLLALEDGHQKKLLLNMRAFYQKIAEYLPEHLPLNSNLLKGAQCLHPEVRDQDEAVKYLRILCNSLPSIPDENVSAISDEWKVYRSEQITDANMYSTEGKLHRIDTYWNYVLSIRHAVSGLKYPKLSDVVHTCLAISHGNADVERSLSINKKILTFKRTCLTEESLNGLRLTRDVVTLHGKVTDVPVTKELLSSVRQACKRYAERKEAERLYIILRGKKSR